MADLDREQATVRSEERRRLAERRAEEARRRASVARAHAETARRQGNGRAAAVHDHEASIHQRAVDIHLQAVRLQEQHARELAEISGRRTGIDGGGLRQIVTNVRRARNEAELRSEHGRTFALNARERARQLHGRRRTDARDA